MIELVKERYKESIELKNKVLSDDKILESIERVAQAIITTYQNGGKVVICGNGGSASDALHFAGELVGRFQMERKSYPAVVLNADVASMTAIANDYNYEEVYARQAVGMVNANDLLFGISTSGNSENIYRAIQVARENGAVTVGLLGKEGGKIKDIVEHAIVIPGDVTARIQECHILTIHIICEIVEAKLAEEER